MKSVYIFQTKYVNKKEKYTRLKVKIDISHGCKYVSDTQLILDVGKISDEID